MLAFFTQGIFEKLERSAPGIGCSVMIAGAGFSKSPKMSWFSECILLYRNALNKTLS